MPQSDDERERQFSQYCRALLDRSWNGPGIRFDALSEYEQETVALIVFNSDYGGNGIVDYVNRHRRELLDHTLRGLTCIGARRLAVIVREYYGILNERKFAFGGSAEDLYDFINRQPSRVQTRLDDLQKEAAGLYSDFYSRWWRYYFEKETVT